jgi:hypothetical protein
MPISWDGLLVQYVGRLHRQHPGKKEVRVFDYVDGAVPVLRRILHKRLKGYRATGYEKGELLMVSNCSPNPTTMKAHGTSIWRRLRTAMMSEPPRCAEASWASPPRCPTGC